MSQEWYYAKGDQKQGPITSDQLRAIAKAGQLKPKDLVWTEGMADWKQASSIKGLIPPSQSIPPPLKTSTPVKPPSSITDSEFVGLVGSADSPLQQPWYCHWAILSLTTLCCFPATLVLVWWKSTYSKMAKWAWTGACGIMWLMYVSSNFAERKGTSTKQGTVTDVSVVSPNPPRTPNSTTVITRPNGDLDEPGPEDIDPKLRTALLAQVRPDQRLYYVHGICNRPVYLVLANSRLVRVMISCPATFPGPPDRPDDMMVFTGSDKSRMHTEMDLPTNKHVEVWKATWRASDPFFLTINHETQWFDRYSEGEKFTSASDTSTISGPISDCRGTSTTPYIKITDQKTDRPATHYTDSFVPVASPVDITVRRVQGIGTATDLE